MQNIKFFLFVFLNFYLIFSILILLSIYFFSLSSFIYFNIFIYVFIIFYQDIGINLILKQELLVTKKAI